MSCNHGNLWSSHELTLLVFVRTRIDENGCNDFATSLYCHLTSCYAGVRSCLEGVVLRATYVAMWLVEGLGGVGGDNKRKGMFPDVQALDTVKNMYIQSLDKY